VAPAPAAASCLHGLERRQLKAPDYDYSDVRGPLNWHGISPAYKKCATGRNQSPINIRSSTPGVKTVTDAAQRPRVNYPSVKNAQLKNLGSTIQVHVNGTLTYEGVTYALRQFHFHTPSEHRLQDEYFPFEAHFVHERVGERTF
jgi:carbonic anhydrase